MSAVVNRGEERRKTGGEEREGERKGEEKKVRMRRDDDGKDGLTVAHEVTFASVDADSNPSFEQGREERSGIVSDCKLVESA